jgi:hypothetical protein
MDVKWGRHGIKQVDQQTCTQMEVDSWPVSQLTWVPALTLPQGWCQPHSRCTGEECNMSLIYVHYKPRCSLCPYYVLHTSSGHLDPQEEDYALYDILYLNDYENRTD